MADAELQEESIADEKHFRKLTNGILEIPCTGEFASEYAALRQFKELIRITKTLCEREQSSSERVIRGTNASRT